MNLGVMQRISQYEAANSLSENRQTDGKWTVS